MVVMVRRAMTVGVAAALAAVACASRQPDPLAEVDTRPLVSADRLGDADAPEPPPVAATDPVEDRYLTPAERDALAAQGYEPRIDDRVVTQTRVEPPKNGSEQKGPWGRAADHMGRGFVAIASVAMVIGAAVAPFFLF